MEAKFKIGDNVKIKNHPDSKMINKTVVIKKVAESKFKEGTGFNYEFVYKVSDGKKSLGWAPESDLSKNNDMGNNLMIDKYNLNKNWGVPFEIEKQINEEFKKSVDSGVWLAISEFSGMHEAKELLPVVIRAMGFNRDRCVQLMDECNYNNDILKSVVNKMFVES